MRDHFTDLVEARLDLAVHRGEVADSAVVARRLGVFGASVVAAPAYLDRHGTPGSPAALQQHACIVLADQPGSAVWHFTGPDGPFQVKVSGSLSTNNEQVALLMARQGQGIALLPEIRALDDVQAGRLVRLFPDYRSQPAPLHILYPSRRNLAPRTRVVMEFVVREIRAGAEASQRAWA